MNSKPFAKIFDTEKYGQVLVRMDTDDDGQPCICHTVNMNDMYITSTVSLMENEDPTQVDQLENTFNNIDQDNA